MEGTSVSANSRETETGAPAAAVRACAGVFAESIQANARQSQELLAICKTNYKAASNGRLQSEKEHQMKYPRYSPPDTAKTYVVVSPFPA